MCHNLGNNGTTIMSSSNAANKKSKRRRASETPSTLLGYDDELDTGDVFNAEQQELLDLIEKHDVNEVKEFFARGPTFDVSRGQIGRVALRLAIYNERADIAEILLQNGVRVGTALFSAVIEGSRECVELFLDSHYISSGDIGPTDRMEGFFMTPLMLAIRLEDHDIIQYMVSKGFEIDQPDCAQGNQPGENQEEMLFLLHINSYRALANPLYMAYSYLYNPESEHPIYSAFTLLEALDRKATVDHEFKRDYKELAKGCEEFAVSLLEQCRTMDEIKILTDVRPDIVSHEHYNNESKYIEVHADTEEGQELTFLNMALRNRCDKLVAHPYSQLRLNIILHTGIPQVTCCESLTWRNRSFLSKVIYSVRHMLLLPFLAIIYLLVPSLPLSMAMSKPLVKFLSHTGSFVVFLFLLIISAFQDEFHTRIDTPSIVEWTIFVWVMGLAVQELKVFCSQGSKMYRRQWWNLVSLLMVTFFVLSYCFQIIAYASVGSWAVLDRFRRFIPSSGYKAILVANSLFTVGMVLSFFHISSAFQVNAIFGPMQLSLYKLFRDVLKFLVFFGLLFVAFGLSLRKLYSHYVSTQYQLAKANRTNSAKNGVGHHFARVDKSLESLFWSLFGLTDLDTFEIDKPEFQITRETGVTLFGLYQVLIVVVAINMLIAMMTRSFERIVQAEDLHWKVSRTRMWMNWVNKGCVLPPPYNLIPNPKAIFHWFRRMRDKYRGYKQNPAFHYEVNSKSIRTIGEIPREVHGIEMVKSKWSGTSRRRKVLKQIVERYLHKRKEDSRREDSENLKDIKVIQELMWQELGKCVDGFPMSPFALTPGRRLTVSKKVEETSL